MSVLKPTKTQAKALYEALEREDATLADVALEALEISFDEYEKRGKWLALVQPLSGPDGPYEPGDSRRNPTCLGLFPTQKQAATAAAAAGNEVAHVRERYVTWVLPMGFESPADYRSRRKELLAPQVEERDYRMPDFRGRKCEALFVLPGARGIARCENEWPCKSGHAVRMSEADEVMPEGRWLQQPDIDLSEVEDVRD